MKKHKVLLLGLGFWGGHWIDIITKTERSELVGIAGSQQEVNSICEKYSLSKDIGYTDYKEAIETTKADIAIIVLPAVLHFDAAKLAMEKGINIIMEKPLSMNIEEAKKLIDIKKKCGNVKFMASQNYRWRPHNQTIKKAILQGMIGDVEDMLVEFRKPEDLQGYRAGLDQPLLRDVSIHHFDLMRFFTNSNCKEIYASSNRPTWSEFEGRPNTQAVITMEKDIKITYNGSWASRGNHTSWDGNFTITGSKGVLTLDANDEVKFYEFKSNGEDVLQSKKECGKKLEHVDMEFTEIEYGFNKFMDCIEKDAIPETTLEDNYKSFAMVCGALESVETNKVIKY
ncbi:MAG: Gfo/Idh/MocA family oxidoreductase [Maledivibacter sp.]|jgi:predicted dehydrogenase|nr:Gfo/Idh/MocA family oxidoreductase [Maledivibacter sp.]